MTVGGIGRYVSSFRTLTCGNIDVKRGDFVNTKTIVLPNAGVKGFYVVKTKSMIGKGVPSCSVIINGPYGVVGSAQGFKRGFLIQSGRS